MIPEHRDLDTAHWMAHFVPSSDAVECLDL